MIIPFKTDLGNIKFCKILVLILLLINLSYENVYGDTANNFIIKKIIAGSTRDLNPTIIYWINDYDLETAIIIVKSLSIRKDFYIGDIIKDLAFNSTAQNTYIKEYILRILLYQFFNSTDNYSRVKENSLDLKIILDHLQNFKKPALKAGLIKILPLLNYIRAKSILMLESEYLIRKLKSNSFSSELNLETSVFFKAVHDLPDKSFLEPVIMISALTKDREITENSRKLLNFLSAFNNKPSSAIN